MTWKVSYNGLTVGESLFWKSLESGARKGFSFSPLRYNQASSTYPIKHKKWNQDERASAADQKTYFLSERTFQYEFKLSNLRNSKINALAKTCISWLSFHRPVMFLLCFFPGLPNKFLLSMTKWKISWTDAAFQGQDPHSGFFFFFLEATSGCMSLFPLEMQRLWTWLAAQFVCSCRTASRVVSGINCSWATSDFVLPQPPPSFYIKQTPKELGQDSGWCQPSGPMPSVDIESEAQWCRDQHSVPCEGLGKSIITSVRHELGGGGGEWVSVHRGDEMKNLFGAWDFLVSDTWRWRMKRGTYNDTHERKEANSPQAFQEYLWIGRIPVW